MGRDFNEWLSNFRESIADYKYYIDFDKVHRNVDSIKVELNILNSLVGSKNIEADFINLIKKYPETLKVIPLLLAKRESEIYCQDQNLARIFEFDYKGWADTNFAFDCYFCVVDIYYLFY